MARKRSDESPPSRASFGERGHSLVRTDRRPSRVGVPALLVHQGDGAGGRSRRRRARPAGGRAGARRRVRSGTPRPRAGPARDRRPRRRHLADVRRPRPRRCAAGRDVRAARRPTPPVRRRVRRRHLPLPGRLRADDRRATTTPRSSPGSPVPCGPVGASPSVRSTPTSPSSTSPRRLRRRHRRRPRAHGGPRSGRRGQGRSTCGPAATRHASCACCWPRRRPRGRADLQRRARPLRRRARRPPSPRVPRHRPAVARRPVTASGS